MLLDGVPQADAFFGFIPFSLLPADSIASARITRGSGTGPFGAGAVAGVVIGVSPLGLRWTMFGCVLLPLALLWLCRSEHAPVAAGQTA